MRNVRITRAVAQVLAQFLADETQPQWGYGLMQQTGLSSGRLYPILARLKAAEWLTGELDDSTTPPRLWYRLARGAAAKARAELRALRQQLNPTTEAGHDPRG